MGLLPTCIFASKVVVKSSQNSADEPSHHLALEQTHDLSLPVHPKFFGIVLENSRKCCRKVEPVFGFFEGRVSMILS